MDPQEVLGAAAHPCAELGPISPELALIDPVLAERARMLLPDPTERTRRPRVVPVVWSPPVSERPKASRASERPQRRSRWRRTVLLAGLVFAAGAASGGFFGRKDAASPPVPFEAQVQVRTVTRATDTRTHPRAAPRSTRASSRPRQPGRAARPAANVLGVTTAVSKRGVQLDWQRPLDSDHVAVIRARGARRSKVIVFRGRGTSYRDVSAHPCTAYRYTIVNYDGRGRPSTGVPTSVVTQGCT